MPPATSTTRAEAVARDLLRLGRSGDPRQFVTAATKAISAGCDDVELRLLLVRRLAEFGLFARAADEAEAFPDTVQATPDFARMITGLRNTEPSGAISWQTFGARFEKNRAAGAHHPWLDEVVHTWSQVRDRVELHRDRDGLWAVYWNAAPPDGGFKPTFGDHRPPESVEQLRARFDKQIVRPILLDGVGLGAQLPWLHEATENTFLGASARLYVVETSWVALAVAMHLSDWRAVLRDERVIFCVGPDAWREFERAVQMEEWDVPPTLVVAAPPWEPRSADAESATAVIERLAGATEQRRQALQAHVQAQYAARDGAWWAQRFASARVGDDPVRVLACTSRFTTVLQYSMRDALAALEAAGCETRLLIEPNGHSCVPPVKKLEEVRDFDPDFVFMIDHTRVGQSAGLVDGVPFVTWVQDRLPWLYDRRVGAALGPLDFCMGFGCNELVRDYGYPAERFLRCDMAASPVMVRAGDAGEPAEFDCDVAFATHASETPSEYVDRHLALIVDEGGRKLLGACYEELCAASQRPAFNGGWNIDALLATVERRTGVFVNPQVRGQLLGDVIYWLLDRIVRHQTAGWAADWAQERCRRFHLYGNGWERHERFKPYARGARPHGPELAAAFRGARVNLHASVNSAFHQRVLDGLAAGGLFLVRRNAGDVSHRVTGAILEHVRGADLAPPLEIRAEDLPPPFGEELRGLQQLTGLDPDAPFVVTDERLRNYTALHETGSVCTPGVLWPRFEQVVFGTREEMFRLLDGYTADDAVRADLAREMRDRVLERFTYEALMRRLLAWLGQQFAGAGSAGRSSGGGRG